MKLVGGTFDASNNLGGTKSTCGGLVVVDNIVNVVYIVNVNSGIYVINIINSRLNYDFAGLHKLILCLQDYELRQMCLQTVLSKNRDFY